MKGTVRVRVNRDGSKSYLSGEVGPRPRHRQGSRAHRHRRPASARRTPTGARPAPNRSSRVTPSSLNSARSLNLPDAALATDPHHVPSYVWLARFRADFEHLTPAQQAAFLTAVQQFFDDLQRGRVFRQGLRVKRIQGATGVFEMT